MSDVPMTGNLYGGVIRIMKVKVGEKICNDGKLLLVIIVCR